MKIIIPILLLMAGMVGAEEVQRDPFGPPPEKKAVELARCSKSHRTLKDVPILYGHVGGVMSSPGIAEKVNRGDVFLGGCILGGRDHWVVCTTCEMRFDDEYAAWVDSYPRDEMAPESKRNPKCTPDTVRLVLSKDLQQITLGLAGEMPSFLSCARWYGSGVVVGERVLLKATRSKAEFLANFTEWLRHIGAPENLDLGVLNQDFRELEWKSKGKAFAVSRSGLDKDEYFVDIAWHAVKKEESEQDSVPKE